MKVIVKREKRTDTYTAGKLTVTDDSGKELFSCCTLELPWKNNQQSASCIPEGEYGCLYTLSPSFGYSTYELRNVPGRAGVRIHNGNYTRQIRGCILLGKKHLDIDKDGIIDVTDSKATIAAFEAVMSKKPFILKVV